MSRFDCIFKSMPKPNTYRGRKGDKRVGKKEDKREGKKGDKREGKKGDKRRWVLCSKEVIARRENQCTTTLH